MDLVIWSVITFLVIAIFFKYIVKEENSEYKKRRKKRYKKKVIKYKIEEENTDIIPY